MKCIQCGKKIKEGKWCSIDCKEKFYKENYMGSGMAHMIEDWNRKQKEINHKKFMIKFGAWKKKNPGKGLREYILSKGPFNDVKI